MQQQREHLIGRLAASQADIARLQNSHKQAAEEAANTLKVSSVHHSALRTATVVEQATTDSALTSGKATQSHVAHVGFSRLTLVLQPHCKPQVSVLFALLAYPDLVFLICRQGRRS